MHWAELILKALSRASFQGAMLIGAMWLVCRLVPRIPASWRCWLWWLACLKLVLALFWVAPLPLPIRPADRTATTVASAVESIAPLAEDSRPWIAQRSSSAPPIPWAPVLVCLWGIGILWQLLRTGHHLQQTRQLLRCSEPVSETWIVDLFVELRRVLGISRASVRSSAEIQTPMVLGLLRAVVLLPRREGERRSRKELAMALCHELLHVRRCDLWLGWVPTLAQRLFFFHPLVALAAREYALAREAACDADVMHILNLAPRTYGRLLVRWGVRPRPHGLVAAGAAPSFGLLKRRIQMLQQSSEPSFRLHPGWWLLIGLVALAVLVPLRVVAREPVAPTAKTIAEPGYQWRVDPAGDAYVFLGTGSTIISASEEDLARAHRVLAGRRGLWFEHGGKAYVVRDPATLDEVQALYRPQMEFAGGRKHPPGAQVGPEGRKAEPMRQLSELRLREAEIESRRQALVAEEDRRARQGQPTDDLQSQQKELSREQAAIAVQRDELIASEQKLSSERAKLWDEQDRLSRSQREAAQAAERQLRAVIERALASGIAQEVER